MEMLISMVSNVKLNQKNHLGERWDGITYEEAKKEWLLKYKKTPVNYN